MTYQPRFHVVLHQPEIPGNAGAVGRTCVALEAKLWMIRPLGFRIDEKSLRRAGLDYWQHLAWNVVASWNELVEQTGGARRWMFSKTAERSYTDANFRQGDCLVFGSETAGLPESLLQERLDRCLRIPTSSYVRSLNLSSSVAVAGYEALRQMTGSGGVEGSAV